MLNAGANLGSAGTAIIYTILLCAFILTVSIISLVIKFNRKKQSKKKLEIIASILFTILMILLVFIFRDRYATRLIIEKPISNQQIELCWDECVTVNLTEEETIILKRELASYSFVYYDGYFQNDDFRVRALNMDLDAKAAIIKVNNKEFMYFFMETYSSKEPLRELSVIKNEDYYVHDERNPVTDILDKYLEEHEDQIINEDE